jgi:serine phosphatase RsbU (regulator of sigma subunit)
VDVMRASAGKDVGLIIGDVFTAIDTFVGTAPQFDDITLLVARKNP